MMTLPNLPVVRSTLSLYVCPPQAARYVTDSRNAYSEVSRQRYIAFTFYASANDGEDLLACQLLIRPFVLTPAPGFFWRRVTQ